ncbi:MAG TPA: hypothetical protein VGS58_11325 [Candidatus Sulfopaludibacter sp.]|nr:hypothetical protein [Candidatus Sulfopaludibacter sp.]
MAANLKVLIWVIAAPAFSQGRIDPSLPPEPLHYTRTLLLFPGADTVKDPYAVLPHLTVKQKYQIFWHRTFDISLPVEALMFGGASQAVHYSPHYGSGPEAFAERFGSYAGSIVSASFLTDAFFPSIFHQDPRYFRKGRGSIPSRAWYAVRSNFVTRGDSGSIQFNFSGVLGFGVSTAVTNAWYPRNSVTAGNTFERIGIKLALSGVLNLVREFGGTRDQETTGQR